MKKGWDVKKFSQLFTIKPPKKESLERLKEKDSISFVPMECLNVQNKKLTLSYTKTLGEAYKGYTYFADNDVLLAKITPCFENGKVGIAKNLKNGIGFGSSEFIVFRSNREVISEYLFYYISQDSFRNEGRKRMAGAVGHKRVSKDFIENYELHYPVSLPEQKRIVKILDKAFAAIDKAKENAEKNLQNSKELFESYLQSVFANPGKDWEEKKLGEVCEKVTKGSSPKWQGMKYVDKPGVLFITSENVGANEIILKKRKYVEEKFNITDKKSILQNGDVLTNIVGASIGRTAIFNLNENANINQAVCILRCNKKLLHNKYLTYLLNSLFFRNILHENEINNARANLSLGFFNNLTIPIPIFSKQKQIVSKLELLSIETKHLESIYQKKLADLEEAKKSVLQKAFNGEL